MSSPKEAKVVEGYAWPVVICGGQEFVKTEFRDVWPNNVKEVEAKKDLLTIRNKKTVSMEAPKGKRVNNSGVMASDGARSKAAEWGIDLNGLKGSGEGGNIVAKDVDDRVREICQEMKTTKPVLKFALDNHVDLMQVKGSGKDGVILKSDVEEYMKAEKEDEDAGGDGINASRAVIRHAEKNNINLEEIKPTGQGGMYTKKDVDDAVKAREAAEKGEAAPVDEGGEDEE